MQDNKLLKMKERKVSGMYRKKECVAMLLAGGQGSRLYTLTIQVVGFRKKTGRTLCIHSDHHRREQ